MSDFDEVLFENRGSIGLITLNRPRALNSLTHAMAVAIYDQLNLWADDESVDAVVVIGEGEKAFCAGGDVVKVSQSYQDGTDEWRAFFHDEYLMNIAIEEFPKPYISLVDGITMGGGVGVSIPGDFWVATEKTMFAMPETGLGLIPDVGGGWFLPRIPGEIGMYLALTGARMKAPDLYGFGLATHVVTSEQVPAIIAALSTADIEDNDDVAEILNGFHSDPADAPLAEHVNAIDDIFSDCSVEAILASLMKNGSEWALKQHKIMMTKSPMSMKVSFEQLRRGARMSTFRDNMIMEFRLVCNLVEANDFHEGVRAILIDKDNTPHWSPETLAEITEEDIESFFAPLNEDLVIK